MVQAKLDEPRLEELEAATVKGKRLGRLAAAVGFIGLLIVSSFAWTLNENANQRHRIQKVIDADPCTAQPFHPEACKAYLRGLANDKVFPRSLSCFIVTQAGIEALRCETKNTTSQKRSADATNQRTGVDAGGGGNPPSGQPSPPSGGQPGNKPSGRPPGPTPSPSPSPQPSPGTNPAQGNPPVHVDLPDLPIDICVKNPQAAIC